MARTMQAFRLRAPSTGAAMIAAIANTGGDTMPGPRSAHYNPKTAKAIQWLAVLTLFQAIGIAGLALLG